MKHVAALFAAILFATITPNAATADDRVVAFGDSITYGVGVKHPERDSWAALIGAQRVARSGGCLVVSGCFGRGAAISTYGRVLSKRPDVVVLAYGINDLLALGTVEQLVDGIRSIIRTNRARGIRTYVATITPIRMTIAFDPTRVAYNEKIRSAFGDRVIDFDAALVGASGNLPRRFDSGDGVHPNRRGYAVMAREAGRVLR
jgi:lysophospholipase L1-like esterase